MNYVIGNWKMAPGSWQKAEQIYGQLVRDLPSGKDCTTVIAPPHVYLHPMAAQKPSDAVFALGAQNVYFESSGAHTGEVSADQLSDLGVSYVICGHSERRALGEDNALVAKKVQAVVTAGMYAVLCVGESSREGDWHAFLIEEIESVARLLTEADMARVIVAYEPIWAIGAEEPDTPDGAHTSALLIRKVIRERFNESVAADLPVLYGGSVNAKNIKPFAEQEGLNGVLVGRASRDPKQFVQIAEAYTG